MKTLVKGVGILFIVFITGVAVHGQNNALQFQITPTTSYVTIADSASLDLTQEITLEAFIKLDSLPSPSERYRTIIAYRLSLGGYCLFIGNDGSLEFFLGLTGGDSSLTAPLSWNTGQWYHVAGCYDGTTVYLFRDGTLINSATATGTQPILTGDEDRHIGGWQYPWDPADWFDGVIDEVRISGTARYTTNFAVPSAAFTTDGFTAALWHFNEGTGATADDSSGNNNTGYAYGTAWVTGYPFGGGPTPSITVTAPNGGEAWVVGDPATVTWTSQDILGNVNIYLSTDGGSNWSSLAADTGNDGTQTITVPDMQSTTCRVRVEDVGGTPSDTSNANFSIIGPGNNPPDIPTMVSGAHSGVVGVQEIYSAETTDPDDDQIYYTFDWDDGTTPTETGLVNSGQQDYATHIWQSSGTYNLTVRATDSNDASSGWSASYVVTIEEQQVAQPELSVSAQELNFGKVPIGEEKTLKLNILNNGDGTLSGMITSDSNWLIADPSSFLSDDITIEVTVDNRILNETDGEYNGTLTITSNGGDAEVDITVTATCVLARPNPYNPAEGELTFFGDGIVSGETTIKIFALSGELVKTVCHSELREESHTTDIAWDGKNADGETVASGIYIYVYESPKEKGIGKFTVIR